MDNGKGSWGSWSNCPTGHYVKAVKVKSDEKTGFWYDETGLNGIRLRCSNGKELSSREGNRGQWQSDWKWSTRGFSKANLRNYDKQGTDNVLATAIKFQVKTFTKSCISSQIEIV